MAGFLMAAISALWLGLLTSISPCPLATNIAAVSFIGRDVSRPRVVFLTGLLYSLGRIFAYILLGSLLVTSILSIPQVSYFLQKYMNKLLGPILIIIGMILLDLIQINFGGFVLSGKLQKRINSWGPWGAGFLGIIFALSFCPVSAAFFFGSLVPLSIAHKSVIALPAIYGLGTGLPVFLFASLLAFGTQSLGKVFNKITQLERWSRRLTGAIFILVGIYYSLTYIFLFSK